MYRVEAYLNPQRAAYRGATRRRAGKTRRLVAFGIVIFALGLQGCLSHQVAPYHGSPTARPVSIRLAGLGQAVAAGTPTVERQGHGTARHRVFELSAPSVTDNRQPDGRIHATLYESRARDPRPLVVVLPIWGVSAYPSRQVVKRLIRRDGDESVHVLWVHGSERLFDWSAADTATSEDDVARILDRWATAVAGTVIDVRRLIAWAHGRSTIARRPTTIVGFSISAVVGALVAGTDANVEGGIFVVGGAHLDQIMLTCNGHAERFVETVRERLAVDDARLGALLRNALDPIDPVYYVGTLDPRKVLVVEASRDDCIPPDARRDFWQALGRPARITVGYNHRRAFLTMTPLGLHRVTGKVIEFLDRTALAPFRHAADSPFAPERPTSQTVSAGPDRPHGS